MKLIAIPALQDNYVWMLHNGEQAVVVDPGDEAPVFAVLQQEKVRLQSILITHCHADHTGGVQALRKTTGAQVYGPADENVPQPCQGVFDGQSLALLEEAPLMRVLSVPGHTRGHLAYFTESMLFCGDALFSGGCGRIFGGTPAQMLASLDTLAAFPGATQVCCAHEYTLGNLRFALAVEPDNPDTLRHVQYCTSLREHGQPTVPSTMALEHKINPFLRLDVAEVIHAAQRFDAQVRPDDRLAVFTALRRWKNEF